ncbi:hypothetical protein E3N88_34287 [Mikania micrantha]|uniref:TTF-type domain-containing protein n=1 Tax=Mikania micrantha TaxID=192012 RepID=A0A5N6LXQ1_9ASTR|nr:hypothetical protein E3N88_34287 [Mikania micrantha]
MNKSPVEEHVEEHVKVVLEDIEEEQHVEGEEHVQVETEETEEQQHVEENVNRNPIDIFDPIRWEGLTSDDIKLLVEKGPKRDTSIVYGPYDVSGPSGRRFSTALFTRTLSNMEKCDREWLVYSRTVDKIFCFCCKLFRKRAPKGGLDGEGYQDWHHASTRVKEHEVSLDHLTSMNKWFDMRKRLKLNETIDKVEYEQLKKERDYWKQVLLRIIALVKFLAKHNLTFRGKKEKLYQKGRGVSIAYVSNQLSSV